MDATASVSSNTIQESTHAINLCYGQSSATKNTINDAAIGVYNPLNAGYTGGSTFNNVVATSSQGQSPQ